VNSLVLIKTSNSCSSTILL